MVKRRRVRSKFGVYRDALGKVMRTYNGRLYDSQAEANYAKHLDSLLSAGQIAGWRPQARFVLHAPSGAKVGYHYVDFAVDLPDGTVEYREVKGRETDLWRWKVKHLRHEYAVAPVIIDASQWS